MSFVVSRAFTSCLCWKTSLSRTYSTPVVTREAMRKWHVSDAQKPKSVLDDSDAPLDLSEDEDLVNGDARNPNLPPIHKRRPPKEPTPEYYAAYRASIAKQFPAGWNPPRKISREAMDGLRQLHQSDPETFTTPVLAEKFKISPEGVRRILKSRWTPSSDRSAKMARRERDFYSQRNAKEREELEEVIKAKKEGGRGKDGLSFE